MAKWAFNNVGFTYLSDQNTLTPPLREKYGFNINDCNELANLNDAGIGFDLIAWVISILPIDEG